MNRRRFIKIGLLWLAAPPAIIAATPQQVLLLSKPPAAPATSYATGDIMAVRIANDATHNGWTAEIDIYNLATGGTYALITGTDPSTAKISFTVSSAGYDATGAATTITRTVYGTMQVRKPYPDNATMDEAVVGSTLTVKVALSDFVYSGDTLTMTAASGFYTKTAVPNNAVAGLAVTNNSTLV